MQLGETTESTDLTELHSFVGAPGTGAPMAQARACLRALVPARSSVHPVSCLLARALARRRPPLPARCTCPAPALRLQPFQVTLDSQALLVMDFHAHLR